MVCPYCDEVLSDVAILGFDDSFRCLRCGSFGMEPWVVNQFVEKDLGSLSPLNIKTSYHGSWKCPRDQAELFDVGGEDIPKGVNIKKCDKCSWWWFEGDALFMFKRVYDEKQSSIRMWSKKSEKSMLVLPAIFTLVLAVGLVAGIRISQMRNNPEVGASAGLKGFGVVYKGFGEAEVYFRTAAVVKEISYQQTGAKEWLKAETKLVNGVYTVILKELVEESEYMVRVGDQEYKFVAR